MRNEERATPQSGETPADDKWCPICGGCTPCPRPSICESFRRADEWLKDKPRPRVSPPDNWDRMNLNKLYKHFLRTRETRFRVPQSTYDAVLYVLRTYDLGYHRKRWLYQMLARFSDDQLSRIITARARLAAPWAGAARKRWARTRRCPSRDGRGGVP
jgi:hypothetical protein